MTHLGWLVVALPSAGALVLLIGGRRTDGWGHLLGCATVLGSFAAGLTLLAGLLGRPESQRSIHPNLFRWVAVADLQIDFGTQIDQLSICFVLLITGVGALIHVYSIGYMADDPDRRRFFAYLNLFIAAMLLLVVADNYLGLYVGWEGVGLASYLLIGFWYQRPSAATAAKKAFVSNRVGDVGLSLAMFAMFAALGTLSFDGVFAAADGASSGTLTAISLLLLLGAAAKSAQVPVQAWLFDAMEGPTPVSALIHAATMVTAGVYLIVRSAPLYDLSPDARLAVVVVGALTLLFGAIIGCAKDDIKRALAASTVSQIGYMVLAAGLGPAGYAFAILHLLTHGFFKAGMFLATGSVMHGMNEEVDMRRFGVLARRMPLTFITFTCGYLAIIGFPYLSGFFSKDPIIASAFAAGGTEGALLGGAAILGSLLTAFYMTRLMIMTFFGEARWKNLASADGRAYHPHEAPPVMTVPMLILAAGSLGAGAVLASGDRLVHWLAPAVGGYTAPNPTLLPEPMITWGSVLLMVIGGVIAYLMVGMRPVPVGQPATRNPVVVWARADVGGNVINETLVARPGVWLARLATYTDARGIDGIVGGIGTATVGIGAWWRRWQNGYVRSYALSMLGGTLFVSVALMVVNFS